MSTNTLVTEQNGNRNVVIRATQISDGTDQETVLVYDATSAAATGVDYGVIIAGAHLYPGLNTKVVGLDYDVQDMKIRIQWAGATPVDLFPMGSAPEDFNWRKIGGMRCPSDVYPGNGLTGSLQIVSVDPIVDATYFVTLYLLKNVPGPR